MRLRILVFLLIVVIILFVANYITGRVIAGILDDVIQEQVAEQTPDATISYDRIGVNPFMARVHLDDLDFSNPDNHRFVSERTSLHLSFLNVLRAVRSDEPLNRIESFVIVSRNSDWHDIEIDRSISFSEGEWQFHGNLGKLFGEDGRPITNDKQQRISFTLSRPVLSNYFDDTPVADFLSPIPENADFNRINGMLEYRPEEEKSYLRSLTMESQDLDVVVNGEFTYDESRAYLLNPKNIQMNFESDSQPGETAFWISPDFGRVTARSASISGDLNYTREERHSWLLEDININYALSNPDLMPAESLQQNYGNLFQNLGINTSRLPARRWQGDISYQNNTIIVRDTEIETAFFDLGISLEIMAEDRQDIRVDDGRIRVHNQSSEFREFLNDLETLIGLNLKREDDELIMRLSGPVQDLSFQFGDE